MNKMNTQVNWMNAVKGEKNIFRSHSDLGRWIMVENRKCYGYWS